MAKPKKERDIVKLLYEENKEYEILKALIHKRLRNSCKSHISIDAHKQYGLDLRSVGNEIIGYIEHLENQINELKNGNGSR